MNLEFASHASGAAVTMKPRARVDKAATLAKRASPHTRATMATKTPAQPAKPKKATVRIFVSYCHANAAAQEKLQIHLAHLKRDEVETWFDGDMHAGDKLNTEISRKLREAHVFVALMSPEYIASHWCQLEYRRAMGRRARGSMRVVVVVLRHCDWKATGASELKVLPRDGRQVSSWRTMDEAFYDVTQGLRGAVRAVRATMAEAAKAKPKAARQARTAAVKATRATAKTQGRTKRQPDTKGPKQKRPTRNRAAR
ncbi:MULTISPECIES: toll/interleukin-1 receptor domain-containing protein [unclassified Methylobacterium]|uniref:toll/interleukin-1 receptor domain-containing protein n=1 Tax=unclassified Methylobacterium TaxID=2615210 RepID=UPI0036F9B68F